MVLEIGSQSTSQLSDLTHVDSSQLIPHDGIPHTFSSHENINDLMSYQRQAIRDIAYGDNVLVWAPTGSGKTLIAEIAMHNVMSNGNFAIFASPTKALSNQIFDRFCQDLGPENVGLVTGDRKERPRAPIVVATTEIVRNMVMEAPETLKFCDLMIFDEVHYLDDQSRGSTWEECIMFAPEHVQIVALSATISNHSEISKWLKRARSKPVSVIHKRKRPVKLTHLFWAPKKSNRDKRFHAIPYHAIDQDWLIDDRKDKKLKRIMRNLGNKLRAVHAAGKPFTEIRDALEQHLEFARKRIRRLGSRHVDWFDKRVVPCCSSEVRFEHWSWEDFEVTSANVEQFNENNPQYQRQKFVAAENRKGIEGKRVQLIRHLHRNKLLPAIYFCNTRKQTEKWATEFSQKSLQNGAGTAAYQEALDFLEVHLEAMLKTQHPTAVKLRKCVSKGYAFHHAGMSHEIKRVVEQLVERGLIELLFATTTVAVGVNLPVRAVCIDYLARQNHTRLLSREYAQMAGRAGRLGRDENRGGVAISMVGRNEMKRSDLQEFGKEKVQPIRSHFSPGYRTLLNICATHGRDIQTTWKKSFAHFDATKGEPQKNEMFSQALKRLSFLEEIQYYQGGIAGNGGVLTELGRICSKISSSEILATEAYREKWVEDSDPLEICAIFGAIACTKFFKLNKAVRNPLDRKWKERFYARVETLKGIEERLGITDTLQQPNYAFAKVAYEWAKGSDLKRIRNRFGDVGDGDFITTMRTAAQAIRSLLDALPTGTPCLTKLREANSLISRDEIIRHEEYTTAESSLEKVHDLHEVT